MHGLKHMLIILKHVVPLLATPYQFKKIVLLGSNLMAYFQLTHNAPSLRYFFNVGCCPIF